MTDLCRLIFWTLVDLMRARATLEAEIWVLRQQINVLRRAAPRRQSFGIFDRLIFVGLYRLFPKACDALAIVKPDTIIRWHRAGFRAYWRWKSRRRGGRPTVPPEIRKLIHVAMSGMRHYANIACLLDPPLSSDFSATPRTQLSTTRSPIRTVTAAATTAS